MLDKTFVTNGCSNHSEENRANNDFYATDPKDVELLFTECNLKFANDILEPCAGEGHIAEVFKKHGFNVKACDLIQRTYPLDNTWDFLTQTEKFDGDIVTNPPYDLASQFVEKSLELIPTGNLVVMLLKLTFLESKKRRKLFDTKQLKTVYVFTNRTVCARNGNEEEFGKGGAVAYAWFVWEKGYNDDPKIKWIN